MTPENRQLDQQQGAAGGAVPAEVRAAQEAVESTLPLEIEHLVLGQEPLIRFRYNGNGYELRGEVVRTPSGLVIRKAEVLADAPAGVTTRLMRTAPLAEALTAVRARVALDEARQRSVRASLTSPSQGRDGGADNLVMPAPTGKTPVTDDLLRTVALIYLEETQPGKDRRAIQRLAGRLGRPEGTVRTWLSRARHEGWLGPGTRGRMGAEPGSKLMEWQLEEMKRQNPGLISHVRAMPDGSVQDLSVPAETEVSSE